MRIVPSRIYWCEVLFSYTDHDGADSKYTEGADDYCCVEWFGMGKCVIIEVDDDGVPHLVRVDKDGNDQWAGYWRDWANYMDGILQEEWET